MSIEEASKQLEIAFTKAEKKLDLVGEKVDATLAECEKQKGNVQWALVQAWWYLIKKIV